MFIKKQCFYIYPKNVLFNKHLLSNATCYCTNNVHSSCASILHQHCAWMWEKAWGFGVFVTKKQRNKLSRHLNNRHSEHVGYSDGMSRCTKLKLRTSQWFIKKQLFYLNALSNTSVALRDAYAWKLLKLHFNTRTAYTQNQSRPATRTFESCYPCVKTALNTG